MDLFDYAKNWQFFGSVSVKKFLVHICFFETLGQTIKEDLETHLLLSFR